MKSTFDVFDTDMNDSQLAEISEHDAQALREAVNDLVQQIGQPQHPEPLSRVRTRQIMPEYPMDPSVSMRKNDPWEAGATASPTPTDNWRYGRQKLFAPRGLVAPPNTPETYGAPSEKGRSKDAREAREKAYDRYGDDAGDAGYTILGICIYGLFAKRTHTA